MGTDDLPNLLNLTSLYLLLHLLQNFEIYPSS